MKPVLATLSCFIVPVVYAISVQLPLIHPTFEVHDPWGTVLDPANVVPLTIGRAPNVGQTTCKPPAEDLNKTCPRSTVPADATYGTSGEVRLRIANGGAGQSGLVAALAQAYIRWAVYWKVAPEQFKIDWVTADTTDSIRYLGSGDADIGITYTAAAENRSQELCTSICRVYGFRDHFYLTGPTANPAEWKKSDSVYTLLNKLVTVGNLNNGSSNPPARFLSRYDRSATNILESKLFASIGQIPWAVPAAKWYHQYPVFPLEALSASSLLSQYTLTDRGTHLTLRSQETSSQNFTRNIVIYKRSEDDDASDPLLNPASILLGGKVCPRNIELARWFMWWVGRPLGGQAVVASFKAKGTEDVLYSRAPNCTTEREKCEGWL